MRRGQKIAVSLLTILTFVSYLFAGASLSLATHTACHHCSQTQIEHHDHGNTHHHQPIQEGASCPLSASGQHCERCHSHDEASITLCPGGKFHHEQGEVVSIAKFIVSPILITPEEWPVRIVPPVLLLDPTTRTYPPRERPPSFTSVRA